MSAAELKNEKLLLVDGHAFAYRAFFAIRSLSSATGAPTNALYGFVKMLAKMRAALEPSHLAVVWDGGLAAERLAALPDYKAQRPSMPDDLRRQMDDLAAVVTALGGTSLCHEGVEADDWIATLARQAGECPVVIASSDKDFMQLVSPRVGLLNPNDKSEIIWTAEQVRAKSGVEPAQIVDWLALIGDAVDNIPGVPGVGPKTATDLLRQFGAVEALLARLPEVKSDRVRANLLAAAEILRRNRELIRLRDDLPLETPFGELRVRPADTARLREFYARWGFKSLLLELGPAAVAQGSLF
jgi:DNA polymerase-1